MMSNEEYEAWLKAYDGKCPTCPAKPMPEKRSRCPICREYITYAPDHPGHKSPRLERGKIRWRNPIFKASWFAAMAHMNSHQANEILETLYEPITTESK